MCFRQERTRAPSPPTGESPPQERNLQQPVWKGEEPSAQKAPNESQKQRAVALNVSSGNQLDWENFKAATIQKGAAETNDFKAGRLKGQVNGWKELTKDPNIISLVMGTKIEFDEEINQDCTPFPYFFDAKKEAKIDNEIVKLLSKGVIAHTKLDHTGFVSNIFTRDKPDGSLRLILDLSELNQSVTYRHFKMESLNTAINLMTPGCFMASIDWKDAYYSVPIAVEHRKYLQFIWKGQTYHFTCYPNGLSSAPRNFTKITKVLFSELRKKLRLLKHQLYR